MTLTTIVEARGRAAASSNRRELVAMVLLALLAGVAVAASSVLGGVHQTVVVALLGAGLPTLLVFVARPDLALAAYLFVLPLVLAVPVAAGLNAGEVLTL